MKMINVLQRLAELDSTNPNVEKKVEEKKTSTPVQLEEGLDTSALRMLAGTQPTKIVECGMPAMGAPMPSMTPASLNMSAGNASEIVQMVRGLMDLAKTDAPTQTGMPALGAPMPDLGGHSEPMFAEPAGGGLGGAPIPDVKGLDRDGDGDHDMGDHAAELGGAELGGTDATDLGAGGDDEIMDLIKKIRTGEPVKVTTQHPVKVTTTDPVKKTGGDEGPEDEGMRGYDNSPKEKVKTYNPNDMADMRDKVSGADKEYTPPGSGDNPLPKTDKADDEKKDESAFESQLFAEYKKFVNEGSKVDQNKDGKNDFEDVKIARMKAAAKAKKK
jgi:hypothetical protein